MKQGTARTSLSIKVITGIVLALNVATLAGAPFQPILLLVAGIVTASVLICYFFWTPVAYELAAGTLTVSFRLGRKQYGPVTNCAVMETRPGHAIRVFGNGGLFAGSGIFWNRTWGIFRAYVTTTKPGELVVVETPRTKVLISPADPRGFVVARS